MDAFARLVAKLCAASQQYAVDPYADVVWPEQLEPEQWYTSPEYISLYGTEVYDRLSTAEQQRLSFYEAVNFFSLNIHGEKALVAGLAQRLYRPGDDGLTPYLHHFLAEENKHMVYFGGFCQRYAGKVYADRKLALPRPGADGEDDVLFFAKVLIFEEIVDVYNRHMAGDARLVPIVRQIHLLHHREETRHLAFGRKLLQRLCAHYAPTWSAETLQGVRDYLRTYMVTMWQEYYNPTVYQDAGLADPYSVQRHALSHVACRAHRQRISAPCQRYLVAHGMLTEEFCL
jgi:hypothetical protein